MFFGLIIEIVFFFKLVSVRFHTNYNTWKCENWPHADAIIIYARIVYVYHRRITAITCGDRTWRDDLLRICKTEKFWTRSVTMVMNKFTVRSRYAVPRSNRFGVHWTLRIYMTLTSTTTFNNTVFICPLLDCTTHHGRWADTLRL